MSNEQEAKDAIRVLLNHQNIMVPGYKLGEILNGLVSGEHRTIQQSFVKEIHNFLVEYSESNYDLRNEESVKFAKSVKDNSFHFPFI